MSVDKSLSFGMQNFYFVKSDETGVTYNYYGYITKKGSSLIMRTNKAISEAKYYISSTAFDTVWADKANKTYVYPNALIDPTI
jgi:hypothetical protein